MKPGSAEIFIAHDDNVATNCSKEEIAGAYKSFFSYLNAGVQNTEVKFSLITYGNKYTAVFEDKGIDEIKLKNIGSKFNGSHPIFDSAALAIDRLGIRYSETISDFHPENVIFVLTAFGRDNASKSNTIYDLKDKIVHQTEAYNWKFFLITDDEEYATTLSSAVSFTVDTDEEGFFKKSFLALSENITELLK